MESTVLRLIPKHEKRVIRILTLNIIDQIMIFSFDKVRKCNDIKDKGTNQLSIRLKCGGGVKLPLTRGIFAPDITFLQILYFILLSSVITEIEITN